MAKAFGVTRSEKLAYGVYAVREALNTGEAIAVFLTAQAEQAHEEIVSLAKASGIVTQVKPEAFFLSQLGKVPHQGIMARVKPYAYAQAGEALGLGGPALALSGIENPGNLGAIVRTAAAFGVRAVLLEETGSVRVNASVRRAAAGYLHMVRIARCDLVSVLENDRTRTWIALDPRGKESIRDCFGGKDGERFGLLFGAEGRGIDSRLLERAQRIARIPISADVESLNLAVAVGICLFALRRV